MSLGRQGRRKACDHPLIDSMHQHFEGWIVTFGDERACRAEHLDIVAMLLPEPERSPWDQAPKALCILVEGRWLPFREVLVLALIDQERYRFDWDQVEESFDGIDQRGATTSDHDDVVVVDEQARLREQVGVAVVVAKCGDDSGPGSVDDPSPSVLPERAQRREIGHHHELDLLLGPFKETRRAHRSLHDDRTTKECKCRERILAP